MGDSNIDWTDKVWNPVTGCTPVSEGCRNCYAHRMANRLKGRFGYLADEPFKVTSRSWRLGEPLYWRKPKRIFVCSMGDLFHKDVSNAIISDVFHTAEMAKRHTFLILTKRPKRMMHWQEIIKSFYSSPHMKPKILPNVCFGVSVEDQATADERIPLLLQTPAAKRIVSYEPAIGPVDFEKYLPRVRFYDHVQGSSNVAQWECEKCNERWCSSGVLPCNKCKTLDQIIMGGETGPGARPLHPDWARSVRDQCEAADVPFFFKQWGAWISEVPGGFKGEPKLWMDFSGRIMFEADALKDGGSFIGFYRVKKKDAGHLIDRKEHRELI